MSLFKRLWNVGRGRVKLARRPARNEAEHALDEELAADRQVAAASSSPVRSAAEPVQEPGRAEDAAADPADPFDPAAPERRRTL